MNPLGDGFIAVITPRGRAVRRVAPLPRREFSVRDDYDLLVGVNRHTITPNRLGP